MKPKYEHAALQYLLLRLRPAFVSSAIKRLLAIQRMEINTVEGRFFIDPISDFGAALTRSGRYESAMTRTLHDILRPGHTFVDVGANEGYFSVIAKRIVGPAGKVVAIEPQSRLQPILARNFRLNNAEDVQLVATAVSDHSGGAELYLSPDTNTGSTALTQSTRYRLRTENVTATTLAEVFAHSDIERADLVKMDVEGFEYEAILGSRDLFRSHRIRALALELHPTHLAKRGKQVTVVTDFLSECGYSADPAFENLVLRAPESGYKGS